MVAATLSLKLKPPVLNIHGFHIILVLAPTFIFTVTHCRELEIEAGTEVSQLEQWVLYFPSGWSAQHSCPIFIFLMLVQPIFTWISSLLPTLCSTEGARRTEAYAYVDLSAYGNKRLHFIDQN